MIDIEQLFRLQAELERAGYEPKLRIEPDGDHTTISLQFDLQRQTAAGIRRFDDLVGGFGFSYVVGDRSRAAITAAVPGELGLRSPTNPRSQHVAGIRRTASPRV